MSSVGANVACRPDRQNPSRKKVCAFPFVRGRDVENENPRAATTQLPGARFSETGKLASAGSRQRKKERGQND